MEDLAVWCPAAEQLPIWTCTDGDGEHVSTFVKLTAEVLAEYQARGIGNAE